MVYGLDYSGYMGKIQHNRIAAITKGMNLVLGFYEKEQKEFKKFATELAKAHALCASTDEGKKVVLEIGYFKVVKASLVKLDTNGKVKKSKAEMEAIVNQLLEKSIISEEVIDVFDALGLKSPEVSIISEKFLEEVKSMKEKNLAAEMLKNLLEGNLKAMEKTNLVKAEKFSEKLKKALNKYRNQAKTNAEAIEELIRMAHELTYAIRKNISIDWSIKKSTRAGMRKIIKRLLKKYDYPSDKAKKTLETVLRQVELMFGNVDLDDLELDRVAEDKEEYRV